MANPNPNDTRYFVKFIGDKNVSLAKAHTEQEAELLRRNQYESASESFYNWVRQNTRPVDQPQR